MIINIEREPDLSLYYLGAVILSFFEQKNIIPIEEVFLKIQQYTDKKIHVDFIYYTLDWLFLLSLIKIKEGNVYYENNKTYSAQD